MHSIYVHPAAHYPGWQSSGPGAIHFGHILPTCTNLSVIVIDKPIGLGGTVYTSASMFVLHLCTIYHQHKRFENYILW